MQWVLWLIAGYGGIEAILAAVRGDWWIVLFSSALAVIAVIGALNERRA